MFAVCRTYGSTFSNLHAFCNKRASYGGTVFYDGAWHQNAVDDFCTFTDFGAGKDDRVGNGSVNDTALCDKCTVDRSVWPDILWERSYIFGVDLPGRLI